MSIGAAVNTDHIGEIVRLRVKCWSKRVALNQSDTHQDGDGGDDGDEPTNCIKVLEGIIASIAKTVIVLQGCVEVDPETNRPLEASLPPSPERSRGDGRGGGGGSVYRSRTFVTIQRSRILGYSSLDASCDEQRDGSQQNPSQPPGDNTEEETHTANSGTFGALSNNNSIVDTGPDNLSFQAACASGGADRIFRYQLLTTLARMHLIPEVEREHRQKEREAEESERRRRADAPDAAGNVVDEDELVIRQGERLAERERSDADGAAAREPTAAGGGGGGGMTPPLSAAGGHSRTSSFQRGSVNARPHHQRVLSTGSAIVSVDPSRQQLFDDFLENESVQKQWTRFHNAFYCSSSLPNNAYPGGGGPPPVSAPTLAEAIEVNQRDARNAQIRQELGVHSVLQLLTETKTDVQKMVEEQSRYTSSSSRRRFSPYALRLSRIRTLFKRLFGIQSICGILLALCGGIVSAQAIVTPLTDGDSLAVAYDPLLWQLCIGPAVLATLLGIFMAINARWTSRVPKTSMMAIVIATVLVVVLAIPTYISTGLQLDKKVDIKNRQTLKEFFEEEVKQSSAKVCGHMRQVGCSGWDSICMDGRDADALAQTVLDRMVAAGYDASKWGPDAVATNSSYSTFELLQIMSANASEPQLIEYYRFCPQNCTIAVPKASETPPTDNNLAKELDVEDVNSVDMKYDFSPSRSCGADLESHIKDISIQFIVFVTIIILTQVGFFGMSKACYVFFFRTITGDPPIS